ncbi:MAG: MurR/RpiR family transcriptional regulator [Lachnospiraceae bacterium]
MYDESNLISKIRRRMSDFSKGQKRVADYIIENCDKAAFMTAGRLGKAAGVSESTVVRFAICMGYSGYPAMQKEMETLVMEKIDSFEKIQVATDDMSADAVFANVINADISNIKQMLGMNDSDNFLQAVDIISSARNIYIVGIRNCAPLALRLGMGLRMIFSGVTVVESSNTSEVFEQLLHVDSRDVVIGISFPRYSMRTLKAMEFSNNRNAQVIAITDSKHSPMNMYSSCNLFAPTKMASIVDSYVAPMSLINALIVALNLKNRDIAVRNNEILESVCRDYQYNESDEIDYLSDDLVSDLVKLEN